jgi:hypothetical protein
VSAEALAAVADWLGRVWRATGVERFEASEVACSLAADQVVIRLRWPFPDREDVSFHHVTLRGERVVPIQDDIDREGALAALRSEPSVPPSPGAA